MKMFTVNSGQSITSGIALSFLAKLMHGYSDFRKKRDAKDSVTLDDFLSDGGALVLVKNCEISSLPESVFKLAESPKKENIGFFLAYETPTTVRLQDGSDLHLGLDLDGSLKVSATLPFQYDNQSFSSPLTEQATNWLRHGERGSSSETMCSILCGILPRDAVHFSHPYDASDFKRCFEFLEAVPAARGYLKKMAEVSPQWDVLTNNWSKLENLLSDHITLSSEIRNLLSEVDDEHERLRFA